MWLRSKDPDPENKTDPDPGNEIDPGRGNKIDPDPDPIPERETDPDLDLDPDPDPRDKTDREKETDQDPGDETDPGLEREPGPDQEDGTDPDRGRDSMTEDAMLGIAMTIAVMTGRGVLTDGPIGMVSRTTGGGVAPPPLRLTRSRLWPRSHRSRRKKRSLIQS